MWIRLFKCVELCERVESNDSSAGSRMLRVCGVVRFESVESCALQCGVVCFESVESCALLEL